MTAIFDFVERYALVLLTLAIFAFFALDPSTAQFDTAANLKSILRTQSVLGILVVATVIPLVAGHIDLSVGPMAGLSSLLCAGMMSRSGLPLAPAIVIAVAAGMAMGAANGVLVTWIGINSIVATLGTFSIIGALVAWYSGGLAIVAGISTRLTDLGQGQWAGLPKTVWPFALVAVVAYYVLEHTPLGRYLYAVGVNPNAADLVGLRVRRMGFFTFVVSGALAGVGGVLLVASQGGGNPQLGPNYMLPTLAAVFLGATAITPGRYNVRGAVVAIFLLAISVNGLTLMGAAPWVGDMFNGIALLAGVGISVYSGKARSGRRVRGRTGTGTSGDASTRRAVEEPGPAAVGAGH